MAKKRGAPEDAMAAEPSAKHDVHGVTFHSKFTFLRAPASRGGRDSTTRTVFYIVLGAILAIVWAPFATAQHIDPEQAAIVGEKIVEPDVGGLFSDAAGFELADEQAALVDSLGDEKTTVGAVRLVTLDVAALLNGDPVTLNTSGDAPETMSAAVMEIGKGTGEFLWTGECDSGTSLMVVRDDQVTGLIRQDDALYEVTPLGGGVHALVRIDQSKFPQDHPDEFTAIEEAATGLDVELGELEDKAAPLTGQIRQLDLLVAWTPSVKSKVADPRGRALLAVAEANLTYRKSGVNIVCRLVHSYQTNYTEVSFGTDLTRFRTPGDGFMDEVHNRRKQFGADVCLLFVNKPQYCGLASVIYADKPHKAFASVHYTCVVGNFTFAHEIGHLQGARHNPETDGSTSPFPYGHGNYNTAKNIRTVMSYNCPGGCTRVARWSGP
ncbi:MAG: hypothetical protein IH987_10130, partial [Planctomycetes bacterium]|nr:hypothetical protein [Planctomycetota bacterium]